MSFNSDTAALRIFLEALELSDNQQIVAGRILAEILERLGFLSDVGLEGALEAKAARRISAGVSCFMMRILSICRVGRVQLVRER